MVSLSSISVVSLMFSSPARLSEIVVETGLKVINDPVAVLHNGRGDLHG